MQQLFKSCETGDLDAFEQVTDWEPVLALRDEEVWQLGDYRNRSIFFDVTLSMIGAVCFQPLLRVVMSKFALC